MTIEELHRLDGTGCTLVDTTCGSVLNVWKNVKRYAQDGFTSVIHGKYWHEETQATASQAVALNGGHYLVVLDRDAGRLRLRLHRRTAADRDDFLARFGDAASPGFDPDLHLERVGCANQTTMLSSESLEIGEMFRQTMLARYGEAELAERFRVLRHHLQRHPGPPGRRRCGCSANKRLDLMVVIGGYNSSNTCNLARICAATVPTFHIADPDGLVSADLVRHRDVDDEAGGHPPTGCRPRAPERSASPPAPRPPTTWSSRPSWRWTGSPLVPGIHPEPPRA